MKRFNSDNCKIFVNLFITMLSPVLLFSQIDPVSSQRSDFWQRVQFGGGFGLNIGSGYTDITLAPSGIYNFNRYVAAGVGLQSSFVSSRNYYSSAIYGGSIIGLFNPIEQVQLSLEVEQVRVNTSFKNAGEPHIKDNFWNTGLFVGGGYRAGNVTLGVRYNVLHDKDKRVYSEAFMPFIRVYF